MDVVLLSFWENRYLTYLSSQRRYSERTCEIYSGVINRFIAFAGDDLQNLSVSVIRSFEVALIDKEKLDPRTVSLHLSSLSGFCRYLVKCGRLKSNPVRLVPRLKTSRRLPVFFREESMREFFKSTDYYVSEEALSVMRQKADPVLYENMLSRVIISILFSTGIRRSELISLQNNSYDAFRRLLTVKGKGDKTRMVPVTGNLVRELSVYLEASALMFGGDGETLLRTKTGEALYPVYVDRVVKKQMGAVAGVTGRKSAHVLRHTIATELLEDGTELNSIKELLGHSSLAATQVYTHNSIERLRTVYKAAHPRSKSEP